MLSACAGSPAAGSRPSLDPVTRTELRIEKVCPAALTLEDPPAVDLPAGAIVSGNREGLDYVAGHLQREALLGRRLGDARADCPKPPGF